MASSYLTSRLLPHHRRHLSTATILTCCGGAAAIGVSSMTTTITTTAGATKKSNFHTTTVVRRPGYKPERNPKIGITLEQLRMAARGQGRRLPICHEQQERVMNSLEAAKYEVSRRWIYIICRNFVLLAIGYCLNACRY